MQKNTIPDLISPRPPAKPKPGIERLLLVALGGVILLIIVVSTLTGYYTDRLLSTSRNVEHTQNVLFESEQTMSVYKDIYSGSRGYILTGSERSLARFKEAKGDLFAHLNKLKSICADNRLQQSRIDSLSSLMASRISVASQAIAIRDKEGLIAASKYLTNYQRENQLGEIRRLLKQIQEEESRLLALRKEASESSLGFFKTILLTLLASVIILLIVVTFTVIHTLNIRNAAVVETQKANAGLEQKVLERTAELQKNERLFRALIENNADMMTMSTLEGKTLYCSPSVTRVLGYTQIDFFNRSGDFVYPADMPGLALAVGSILQHPGAMVYQRIRLKHQNGEYRWCEATILNLLQDPNVNALVSNFRDIHDKKIAEDEVQKLNENLEDKVKQRTAQLEAANKELEAFSYSVSHDLRAPLRAISGFARIFHEDFGTTLNTEGHRLLNVIRHNAEKMGTLIDDLLAFSRLGRQPVKCIQVDMNDLVETSLAGIRHISDIKAEVRIKPLGSVMADPVLLNHAVTNLLSNAIKYSGKVDKPIIEVSSFRDNGYVVYKISDNGVGFDMEYVNKLFGVFQRLHANDEFEGTGVGLAIVQRIIHKHNGHVWAVAEPEKGADFYFSLPMDNKEI
ncbi:MAG TPA: CHASE3 domain-containing protein [Chitinophagales bacterium]|nr:CHASE3 domain-containing protein [Chitinophagales bacterium]